MNSCPRPPVTRGFLARRMSAALLVNESASIDPSNKRKTDMRVKYRSHSGRQHTCETSPFDVNPEMREGPRFGQAEGLLTSSGFWPMLPKTAVAVGKHASVPSKH